jgi:hypothetical protein
MNGHTETMSCVDFQAQMPELIATGEDAASHSHARTCARCSALLADLTTIAETARQLFPSVEPPDEVWEHIESAIRREDKATFGA